MMSIVGDDWRKNGELTTDPFVDSVDKILFELIIKSMKR